MKQCISNEGAYIIYVNLIMEESVSFADVQQIIELFTTKQSNQM